MAFGGVVGAVRRLTMLKLNFEAILFLNIVSVLFFVCQAHAQADSVAAVAVGPVAAKSASLAVERMKSNVDDYVDLRLQSLEEKVG